jgi:putative transposase
MLDNQEFDNWCQSLNLSQAARAAIAQIRSSAPSRRVRGGRRNVCGSYPSRKMAVTIQFESHRNELARIYELENAPQVLEYYDQPPPIELLYQAKSGRRNRHQYTPDFFVIWTDSAGWEECKTERDLIKLAQASPHRYQKNNDGKWHCPPGEKHAQQFGFYFRIHSDAEINWSFQQNLIWLEDYIGSESLTIDATTTQEIFALVENYPGLTLEELLEREESISPDLLYSLIATGQLYVDLRNVRLSEPQQVKIFLNQNVAQAYERINSVAAASLNSRIHTVQVAVGIFLIWDSECWEVVNTGATSTGLLRSDGKFVELPNAVLETLIHKEAITAASTVETSNSNAKAEEILRYAKPEDVVEANRRYEALQPYLGKNPPQQSSSTIRRWRTRYRKAETLYGNGYVGLLPSHSSKGNYTSKVDEQTYTFMLQFIEEHYENLKQRRKLRVYEAFVCACETHQPKLTPPSRTTFSQAIERRAGYAQTKRREGRRAAIQKEPFYWELELTTPRHGNRPFEIVHIDHTQLDVELVSSLESLASCSFYTGNNAITHNLGRPWATFMVDAYSRRILAVYLSFEQPSYRCCMMAIRCCVSRFKRFPQSVVVDNGTEFHSHYFEQLLAYYVCTKKHRPPAHARFGSVIERLFGTANTQLIHELQGNTQILRQQRQITKSVNPQKLAIWTLSELYEALCEWAYEIYDKRPHPALGQSPRDAFESGLAVGGNRLHKRVEYDEVFHILTLPAPDLRQRKVQPGHGVKIHNIYYWSNIFRDPEVEKSMVEVRYDPFDASIAYALVKGQWVKCISSYYQYLQGRSQREIQLVSTELNKRQRDSQKKSSISDKELVQFLNSQQAKEGQFLEQRLRAAENKTVIHAAQKSYLQQESWSQSNTELSPIGTDFYRQEAELIENKESGRNLDAFVAETLEYYGEF